MANCNRTDLTAIHALMRVASGLNRQRRFGFAWEESNFEGSPSLSNHFALHVLSWDSESIHWSCFDHISIHTDCLRDDSSACSQADATSSRLVVVGGPPTVTVITFLVRKSVLVPEEPSREPTIC